MGEAKSLDEADPPSSPSSSRSALPLVHVVESTSTNPFGSSPGKSTKPFGEFEKPVSPPVSNNSFEVNTSPQSTQKSTNPFDSRRLAESTENQFSSCLMLSGVLLIGVL